MYVLKAAGRAMHRHFHMMHTAASAKATPTSRPHTHLNYRTYVELLLLLLMMMMMMTVVVVVAAAVAVVVAAAVVRLRAR